MIIKFRTPHNPVYGIWTEEAAQQLIGQEFEGRVGKRPVVGNGKVLDAVVADEGRSLELMVEWPDDPGTIKLLADVGMAVSLKDPEKIDQESCSHRYVMVVNGMACTECGKILKPPTVPYPYQ